MIKRAEGTMIKEQKMTFNLTHCFLGMRELCKSTSFAIVGNAHGKYSGLSGHDSEFTPSDAMIASRLRTLEVGIQGAPLRSPAE